MREMEIVNLSDEKPEIAAVAMAMLSRSGEHISSIIHSITDKNKVAEKTVSWGHDSVAELSDSTVVLHGVSMLLAEELVDPKRAVASVSSTRYQVLSAEHTYTPPIKSSTLLEAYKKHQQLMHSCFSDFNAVLLADNDLLTVDELSELGGLSPTRLNAAKKAKALDSARYFLPASQQTSVGLALNARDARDLISKLRMSGMPEYTECAELLHREFQSQSPTFVNKYLKDRSDESISPYPIYTYQHLQNPLKINEEVVLLESQSNRPDPMLDNDLDLIGYLDAWNVQGKCKFPMAESVSDLGHYSFVMRMDYGAWRDLHRHRRCNRYLLGGQKHTLGTRWSQPTSVVTRCRLHERYNTLMEDIFISAAHVSDIYEETGESLGFDFLSYLYPLGTEVIVKMSMDLGELAYLINLRTTSQGHESYRRTCALMLLQAIKFDNSLILSTAVGENIIKRCLGILSNSSVNVHI